MIRFKCIKCGEYCQGGPEDKKCPICDGTLIFVGLTDDYD